MWLNVAAWYLVKVIAVFVYSMHHRQYVVWQSTIWDFNGSILIHLALPADCVQESNNNLSIVVFILVSKHYGTK